MGLLLLLSTISWKVEKHYCMGRLMNVALFTDAETCGMDMAMSMSENSWGETKNSCCDDEVIFVDGQDDLKISFNDLNVEQQSFLIVLTHTYLGAFQDVRQKPVPHEQYPPPLLIKDIQLLDEVYLI